MEADLAAIGLVFVAGLGDKTQLVALGLVARHRLAPVLAPQHHRPQRLGALERSRSFAMCVICISSVPP